MNFIPEIIQLLKKLCLALGVMLILAAAAIGCLWFFTLKPYAEGLERPRVPTLQQITVAQKQFRQCDADKDGIRDYGSLDELLEFKLLNIREIEKAGLVYCAPATSDPQNRWWAVVQALHPMQGRSFFINHTGFIYWRDGFDLESRVNRATAQVPTGMYRWQTP